MIDPKGEPFGFTPIDTTDIRLEKDLGMIPRVSETDPEDWLMYEMRKFLSLKRRYNDYFRIDSKLNYRPKSPKQWNALHEEMWSSWENLKQYSETGNLENDLEKLYEKASKLGDLPPLEIIYE
jgi:hypothetical protein